MSKKIIFLFYICFKMFAQESNPYLMYEFFIGTTNAVENYQTDFYFNAVSDVFCIENGYMNFTDNYNNEKYSIIGNSPLSMDIWKGLEFCSSNQYHLNTLAYGKYKITVNNGYSYFYFDLRDCNYPFDPYAGKNDIWFAYDVGNDRFFWSKETQGTFDLNADCWQYISDSTTIGIWQKKALLQNLECFIIFPKNITLTWENNYLKISWDRIDLGNVESYNIYKKVEGCEEVLARTEPQASGGDRQTWTDYSVTKPKRTDPMFKIDYRIRTKTTDGIFSNYSPKKGIYGNTGIWKKNIVEEEENDNYKLYQNTPNPFNPSTTISFTIPSSTEYYSVLQNVTLKVYDILGNEVATSVDENKPAGNYEVKFDGSNLAGGIYFYKLQSGSFAQTKKLLLLK